VTSIVRALNLRPGLYTKLFKNFHSSALKLDRLSALWAQAALRLFPSPLQEPAASEEESTLVKTVRAELKGNETLKELIVLLLDTCTEDWWTANEIKDHLSDVTGRDIPISSISPTLTVMKDAGILVRTGHNVALASRIPQGQEEKQ
jgi:hypothetical protein